MAEKCAQDGCKHPAIYRAWVMGRLRNPKHVCGYHLKGVVELSLNLAGLSTVDPHGIVVWGRVA